MMPDKKISTCPYLSHNAEECLLTSGGLYLPLPEHIDMFCKTSSFVKCHHYIVGCEEIRNATPKVAAGAVNRRHYRRVQERLSLVLAKYSTSGAACDILDSSAFTIDLSMGGIGFVSRHKILPKTKIKFTLGGGVTGPSLTGIGEVRWTEGDSMEPDLFLSGLSFMDSKSKQIIGRRLWTSNLPAM